MEDKFSSLDMGSGSDDEDGSYDYCDDKISNREQSFIVLNKADIQRRQEEDISQVSQLLSVSRWEARVLLHHFKWSMNNVQDSWFSDERKVRRTVGLLENFAEMPNKKEMTCEICLEVHPRYKIHDARCGHPICSSCWKGHFRTSIDNGPGCLELQCPSPSCNAIVGQDLITMLSSDEDKEKYSCCLLRSYIEDNDKRKWCPAPGCECAVEYTMVGGSFDVTCNCGHSFCWKCSDETHRPVDCNLVLRWKLKNSDESESMNWILSNSKPCPECRRWIQKTDGSMHMTCTFPCEHQFCWLCLGPWSEHDESTGGIFACTHYETAKLEGHYDEAERRLKTAKMSLERYTQYCERWEANESSEKKALDDLKNMQKFMPERLSENQPGAQLKFITEAFLQIVKCRSVLKWTYAYGYYLPEEEDAKRTFLEFLQGQAESRLEELHQCAERELLAFIVSDGPSKEFNDSRTNLYGLTSVTRNHFEKLVEAVESGLQDVRASGGHTMP